MHLGWNQLPTSFRELDYIRLKIIYLGTFIQKWDYKYISEKNIFNVKTVQMMSTQA